MRAFIAVDLSEDIRAKVEEIERRFGDLSGIKLKFVNPKQAHQTLKFLGNVSEERVEPIKRELESINIEPFDIVLRGAGFFPASRRKIRVLWIGISEGVEGLKALQEQVETRMVTLGFPAEKQPFSPHITICRVKRIESDAGLNQLMGKIAELSDVEVGEMQVNAVKLKKSTLTPRGPIYEDVYVKQLF